MFTKVAIILLAVIFFVLSIYLLTARFDQSLLQSKKFTSFSNSPAESIQIRQRQNFYALELGKVYGNRFGIYYFDTVRPAFNKVITGSLSNLTPLFILGFLLILINVKFKLWPDDNQGSKNHFWILILIMLVAGMLRFYKLNEIPAGLHADAASQGYNAFSLIHTGKDRYGESFPILFRSNGSYQPPVYTYLTTLPVLILGNTVFAVRFLSALSGVILVLVTYLLLPKRVSLTGALTVAVSPWSVFFSRLTVEANLAVTIFALSVLLLMASLKKKYIFPIACLILGLSTHTYYSERLISVIFLPVFILLFRKMLIKKWLILGLIVFAFTQIPHLLVLQSGAFANRFSQAGSGFFLNNYLAYFSPKNLFFDSGTDLGRLMPSLSTFYNWMLVPFLVGLVVLLKNKAENRFKVLGLLLLVTPVAAGLTGDVFYPLRALDFLWVVTLVISFGIYQIYTFISPKKIKIFLLGFVVFYSLFSLYISYFVLFKYEKAKDYGYAYLELADKLKAYRDKHIVIDSVRDPGIGLRLSYLKSYDPKIIQKQLTAQLKSPYYSSTVNTGETYLIGNIEVKPIDWGEDCKKNYIFVGDNAAISEKEAKDHYLKPEFEIPDLTGETYLRAYSPSLSSYCLKKRQS